MSGISTSRESEKSRYISRCISLQARERERNKKQWGRVENKERNEKLGVFDRTDTTPSDHERCFDRDVLQSDLTEST